ncbi:hypothetical protein C7Y70_14655 [Pseudoalteromonas sp. KS88]|nr:hypothetical protein C7Y70_14655 [Pseudoalteromonas sp. KS88]
MKSAALNERPWMAELGSVQGCERRPIFAAYVHINSLFEGLSVMLGAPWLTSDRNEVSQREEVEAWMLTGIQLQG